MKQQDPNAVLFDRSCLASKKCLNPPKLLWYHLYNINALLDSISIPVNIYWLLTMCLCGTETCRE